MGFYIDGNTVYKDTWLANYAQHVPGGPDSVTLAEGEVLLCYMDNGPFKALGIAHSERETEVFKWTPRDPRPREWYVAKISDVITELPRLAEVFDDAV